MEGKSLLDIFAPFFKNGNFVIEYIFLDVNYINSDVDLWYDDKFSDFVKENYENYTINDIIISLINQVIVLDIVNISKYYNKPDDEVRANVQYILDNAENRMEYQLHFIDYYTTFSKDYKQELINKTVKFFSPIPEEEYRYMDTFDNVYRYHSRIFKDTVTSILSKLLNIVEFNVVVFDIEKTEKGVEVFHIRIPDNKEDIFESYMHMYMMFDFESFFENLYRQYRHRVIEVKCGYEKASHVQPVKVKCIISHQDVELDKIDAYHDAYKQYIKLFANNIIKKRKEK